MKHIEIIGISQYIAMYRKMWKLIITSFIIVELLPFVSPVLPVFNNEFMETKDEQRNYDEYPNLSTNEEVSFYKCFVSIIFLV